MIGLVVVFGIHPLLLLLPACDGKQWMAFEMKLNMCSIDASSLVDWRRGRRKQ